VCYHGWIIWVKQKGSDEVSGREDDSCDAGVPESDRQKSVGHVDEEASRQSGGEGSTGSKILRPGEGRRIIGIVMACLVQACQMNTQGHLQGQQSDQHCTADTRKPYLVHARSGYGSHQN